MLAGLELPFDMEPPPPVTPTVAVCEENVCEAVGELEAVIWLKSLVVVPLALVAK